MEIPADWVSRPMLSMPKSRIRVCFRKPFNDVVAFVQFDSAILLCRDGMVSVITEKAAVSYPLDTIDCIEQEFPATTSLPRTPPESQAPFRAG